MLPLVISFAMHAFIAAGLEATAFGSAKAGPVIGHVLLALADPAPGSSRWPCAGRAEVIMLMAKDRRQPPSIPPTAGYRDQAEHKRASPDCAEHHAMAGIASRSKPVLNRGFTASTTPAAAPAQDPSPAQRSMAAIAAGRTPPEPRPKPQPPPIGRPDINRAATGFGWAGM